MFLIGSRFEYNIPVLSLRIAEISCKPEAVESAPIGTSHMYLSLLLGPRVEVAIYNFAHYREQVALALLHFRFQQDF